MATIEQVREEYNAQAVGYNSISALPCNILETQLLKSALGDLTGQVVLDLGGGTGIHARDAIDAGAASVDVIDLSPEMLRVGEEEETKLGRFGRCRWFEGDTTQPLDHLPLQQYDLVMANFLFDNAKTVEQLEGMWQNVVSHLKPGGRFVGARVGNNPQSPAVQSGKYGVTFKDFADFPGGLRYKFTLNLKEPIEFESTSLWETYSGSTRLPEKFGLVDILTEPFENAQVVKDDPEFWRDFTNQPSMMIVKARKA